MDKIIIKGKNSLKGNVQVSGSKNAALPIIASALLTDGECIFKNIPHLRDVESILSLLRQMGVKADLKEGTLRIDATGLSSHEAPYELVRQMRASILVLGPLLARLKKARVSLPGGCAIGARPVNLHLKALNRLGAEIILEHGYIEAHTPGLKGAEIYFDVPTVTGTENIMMAAVLADGKTIMRNCAREPEIIALAEILIKMGARISGFGTAVITIEGVSKLDPVEARVIPDRIEAGTLMVAAAVTKGDVVVSDCRPDHLENVIHKLRLTGTIVDVENNNVRVKGNANLESVDIKTSPYPGFPTDMQAQFMVMMSIAAGSSIISETIFENRFIHVSELRRMGANITISGNTALIKGTTYLSGAPVMATDLRASASLLLAGLVARGTTEVHRIYHLDRGYEHLEDKLQHLGAHIKRVKA